MNSTLPDSHAASHKTRVIAHRGASGHLPEHTAVSKALAYGLGVDFLEQDIHATRDGELVVLHDPVLDDVSDVARQFPERARRDGSFHVLDFTLGELRQLNLTERRLPGSHALRFPGRFAGEWSGLRIMSLAEEIRLVAELNRTTGRCVGLYPEIKHPAMHQQAGIDISALIVAQLADHARDFSGPVFVQSFDCGALQRLADEFSVRWPLIQLLDRESAAALTDNPEALAATGSYAKGVGLPYSLLMEVERGELVPSRLARQLAASGLLVHPYTLRRDEPVAEGTSYAEILEFLIRDLQVDALFCDHPDDALAVRANSAV